MNDIPVSTDDLHDPQNSQHGRESDVSRSLEEQFSAELRGAVQQLEPNASFVNGLMSQLEATRILLEQSQIAQHSSAAKSRKDDTIMSVNMHANSSLKSKFHVRSDARGFMVFVAALIIVSVGALFLLTYPPTSNVASGHINLLATATPVDPTTQLNTFFTQLTTQDAFSGTVLVARDQTVLLRAGYGLADREWNIANTPDTKFRTASITKEFTATAIMLLQEQGKLNVQDRVCKYLSVCANAWQSITIHELLTHTSGIYDYDNLPNYDTFRLQPATAQSIVNFFSSKPLKFAAGTDWDYSNSGYILLGQVIQKVSGESYASFVQKHFFAPLGLSDTGVEDMVSILPKRAHGYHSPTELAPYIDMTTEDAAGEIYSTLDDLNRWNQALVGGKVVTEKTFNAMIEAAVPLPASYLPAQKYGYGFGLGDYKGRSFYLQAGEVNGFLDLVLYFPQDKTTIIILSNLESIDFQQMIYGPLAILYGS